MIGVLGGTFNPIHHGHLRLALSAYEQLGLSRVHLMLSARPPHKDELQATTEQRWTMLQTAVADEPALFADDCEIHRAGYSYTIDSLKALKQTTQQSLVLILGSDALNGLSTWHQWQSLLDYCHIVVVKRPAQALCLTSTLENYLHDKTIDNIDSLKQQPAGHFYVLDLYPPPCDISATTIRHLIQHKKNPRYFLPEAVRALISAYGLYT